VPQLSQQQQLQADFDSKSLMDLMALMEDQGSFGPNVLEPPPPYPGLLLNPDLKPAVRTFGTENEGKGLLS
jgi:hypothetical protein